MIWCNDIFLCTERGTVKHAVLSAVAQSLPDLGSKSRHLSPTGCVFLKSKAISEILTFNEMIAPVCHCN